MALWFQTGIYVVLTVAVLYYLLAHRSTKKQLAEYKSLFETADSLQKEAHAKIESLLQAIGQKDILLERKTQNLELLQIQLGKSKITEAAKNEEIAGLVAARNFQEEQYNKLLGQKKSSEVRTGKITEQISPFLRDYPLDPATARFIGDPIDFIHFDNDKISFVEVKSGRSQLSKKQRTIRDLVKKGKVEFLIYRVEGK